MNTEHITESSRTAKINEKISEISEQVTRINKALGYLFDDCFEHSAEFYMQTGSYPPLSKFATASMFITVIDHSANKISNMVDELKKLTADDGKGNYNRTD